MQRQTSTVKGHRTEFFGACYAEIYDQVMRDVPYETWADFVEDALSLYQIPGDRLLDLACGTGSLAVALAKRGYCLTAVDSSPHMLAQLKRKLHNEALGLHIQVVESRLAEFKAEFPYDCAFCFFDSINYIIDTCELKRTFANVSRHLRLGGLLMFDVNMASAYIGSAYERSGEIQQGARRLTFRFSGDYSRKLRTATMRLGFFTSNGHLSFAEEHRQRAYRRNEIDGILKRSSLEPLGCFRAFSFEPASAEDDRCAFVYRKE